MNFNQELDTMWGKDNRIAQLEEELAKVTARYNYVRDMTPEDFGDLSTINEDFDSQVDELIKDRIAKYPITRGDDLSIESAREIARTALASQEPTLKNNEFIPDSTEGRIQAAIKCLNMHWVSHDANRFDYAIEGLEKCLAGLASQAKQEPVGWQRRLKFSTNGQVHQWELCKTSEATNAFERSPHHEYRQIFTIQSQAQQTESKPALKVVNGEICYRSTDDDQSYGMWCPVSYDTKHGYKEGTKFIATTTSTRGR